MKKAILGIGSAAFLLMLGSYTLWLIFQANSRIIHVVDENGLALEGVKIYAITRAMCNGAGLTDRNGDAVLPYQLFELQKTDWIRVEKAGYEDSECDIPQKWPLEITLKKK